MTDISGAYYTLLEQFNTKQNPGPVSDNTLIQKAAIPTDGASVSDTNEVTWNHALAPALCGVAACAQAQAGVWMTWMPGVMVTTGSAL